MDKFYVDDQKDGGVRSLPEMFSTICFHSDVTETILSRESFFELILAIKILNTKSFVFRFIICDDYQTDTLQRLLFTFLVPKQKMTTNEMGYEPNRGNRSREHKKNLIR